MKLRTEITLLLTLFACVSGFLIIDRTAAVAEPNFKSIFYGWDDTFYYLWLQTPIIEGNFDFEKGLSQAPSLNEQTRQEALTTLRMENGNIRNKYPIGWALLHSPGFLLAHTASQSGKALGITFDTSGFGPLYQFCVTINGYLYSLLGIFFLFHWLRRYLSPYYSFVGITYVLLSSSLIYYLFRQVSMTHNLVFFLVATIYYLSDKLNDLASHKRITFLIGILSGILIIVRPPAGIYLLYPAIYYLRHFNIKNICIQTGISSLGALPFIALQLIVYKIHYASFFHYSYGEEGFNWLEPQIFNVLFSPLNGAFYWHPILLVSLIIAVIIIAKLYKSDFPLIRSILIISLVIWLNASWWCWWYGASFGNRAFEGIYIFSCLYLAAFLSYIDNTKRQRLRIGINLILYCLVSWNILLIIATRYRKITGLGLEDGYSYKEMFQCIAKLFI